MDTWMGINADPITLHKYLYANANADPVTYVDPTGKFSIGGMMSAVNNLGRLALRANNVYDSAVMLINIANGDMSAKELAMTYLASKVLPRKFFKCKNSFVGGTFVHTDSGSISVTESQIKDWLDKGAAYLRRKDNPIFFEKRRGG